MESTTGLGLVRAALRAEPPDDVMVEHRPLRGGLTAQAVTEIHVRYRDGRRPHAAVVLKRLPPGAGREALVYERLLANRGRAPRLIHVERNDAGVALVLERVHAADAWPWRDTTRAGAVLAAAAEIHAVLPPAAPAILAGWDHEAELTVSAADTLAVLEDAPPPWPGARWPAGPLRRTVARLPELRRELLAYPDLPPAFLHGDLHPGNVILRGTGEVVLLDWERARIGSPLEDVASWLVSLGHHEPEARRRHDTLLAGYLAARDLPSRLGPGLRRAYWIAAASNALAGALRYHLLRSSDGDLPEPARRAGAVNALAWLRVIRRADAHVSAPGRAT